MRLYTYDITEGDKGIIFANSYEEAVELFKADYPEIEVIEVYDDLNTGVIKVVEAYNDFHTCIIEEFDFVPTKPKLIFMYD